MFAIDYVVKRDDIYIGGVSSTNKQNISIHEDGIYDFSCTSESHIYHYFDNRRYLLEPKTQLFYKDDPENERSVLFVLDENNCMNDLLYQSPHYPVFNLSDNALCLSSIFSVKNDAYTLGKFLRYLGYPEWLTYEHIVEIKERFFGDFVLDNSELFGIYETGPNTSCYETYDAKGNHRTFNLWKKNGTLPSCYFIPLFKYRSAHKDSFVPMEEEGPIKSLKLR